jgi:formate dehydrogenase major subunit
MPSSSLRSQVARWPVLRQLAGDFTARGAAARSEAQARMRPRTEEADHVTPSICPFCAVGCGQLVYTRDGQVTQIEGDPASPLSRGRLCPKGAATKSLVTSPLRLDRVRYRPPHATDWQELDLDVAMDMIADRVLETRARTWEDADDEGRPRRRTLGLGNLGGATLDNEENYLIRKLTAALGVVQVENQARI